MVFFPILFHSCFNFLCIKALHSEDTLALEMLPAETDASGRVGRVVHTQGVGKTGLFESQ